MEDGGIRYVVYAVEKIQKRDSTGKFLKKEIRYIEKSCPKVVLYKYIGKAKKYTSRNKASYALAGLCPQQKNTYDFYIMKVKIKIEIDEQR